MDQHRIEDREALELLDAYLARLQAGERPEREAVLRERPDLSSALDAIEALEGLAPPAMQVDASDGVDTAADGEGAGFPRTFGQYELLCEIGRGGMGVVYKAREEKLDRIVAVKMILSSHLASPEHVRRFHVEARAAARLHHSNIVHIHDVGDHHGQHYFTMEYIDGESLAQRLARGPVDLPTAVRIVATVAGAVDHLHRQNIVHRDLKPSNILLDREGNPFVTDFGLAKVFVPGSETTASGVIAGTPSYMAPEQAAGHPRDVGPAADVYSLGAILFELLTGQPPFHEENPVDTLLDVLGKEPEPPRSLNPRVPVGLELICLRSLAKAPADRYSSAKALADDLGRFARGEALEVRPPNPAQRLWSWTRRQPALAMRLGALGTFVAVAWINYLAGAPSVDLKYEVSISILAALWAAGSLVCQQFIPSRRWWIPACFVWGTFDSIMLLALLLVSDGAASPLVIAYPLLIVGSALWFHVRFVSFMTIASLLSYGVLVWDFYVQRPELQQASHRTWDSHVVFAVGLAVMGVGIAYLVHRVRVLSSFYGR